MRRGLGRGLSSLIAEQTETPANEIAIDTIFPNDNQPRQHFDEEALAELAASIADVGLLQPILVRPVAEGRYEIIAGERRWRASKRAGLTHIPAIVRAASHSTALEIALIENIQRKDISPIECARAYQRLSQEFGLTQEQIAEKVGKSRSAVANCMRLLRLSPEMQAAIEAGTLSEGHAKVLLGVENEAKREALFRRTLELSLPVRQLEELAFGRTESTPVRSVQSRDPNLDALERALSEFFGSPVSVVAGRKRGKMVIEFKGSDDLDRILDKLGIIL